MLPLGGWERWILGGDHNPRGKITREVALERYLYSCTSGQLQQQMRKKGRSRWMKIGRKADGKRKRKGGKIKREKKREGGSEWVAERELEMREM